MADPHAWLGRKPAVPLHHICVGELPRKAAGGRIIQPGRDQGHFAAGEWAAQFGGYDKLLAAVTPEDVVYLPLWATNLDRKAWTPDAQYLAPDAPDMLAFLKDLAPRVKAVLLGNAGVELIFWKPGRKGLDENLTALLAFTEHCAKIVTDAGGRPAFGTVDWHLALDAYGTGRLGRLMRSCKALQLCFCGYTLIPEAHCDRSFQLYSQQLAWLDEHEGKRPYVELMRYIDRLDVWSGCNGKAGLEAGQDKHLKRYNYKGGFYRP